MGHNDLKEGLLKSEHSEKDMQRKHSELLTKVTDLENKNVSTALMTPFLSPK